ncbi:hypothetical protein V6N12_057716 [Hibiscus sabdariffa]|uniref:DUF4378 domain-containing protein n=1 Tax=Hibiscus sabdariffa TaxID=183260 RepID=A0ABR2C5Y8_9ROSI
MSMPPPPQGQHSPSCMWGILHVIKYHRWNRRFIKKRISNKKQDAGAEESKDESVRVSNKNAEDSSKHKRAEAASSKVDGKKSCLCTGSKGSVTSRLKALLTEKGRGNHQRSSTYPIRSKLDPDTRVEHLPDMEQSQRSTAEKKKKGVYSESGSEDQAVSKSWEEDVSSDENDEDGSSWNDWSKENVDENTKTVDESAVLSQEEVDAKKKAVQDGPGYESKYLMDALDIVKMNQGFLLTVLQDPDSPLSHHLHKQLAMDGQMGTPQYESYPSTGSTSRGNQSPDGAWFDASSNREKPGDDDSGFHILNQAQAKLADMSSSPSSSPNRNRSEMAKKRFKCLKENLKYVIEEKTKERHRIAMDAVLHKIPHQKGFSKDLSPKIVDHVKDPIKTRKLLSSASARSDKSKEESISESTEERRGAPMDSRRSRKKTMRRILSSPELYSSAVVREAFSQDKSTDADDRTYELKLLESVALDYGSEADNFEKTESEVTSACIREAFQHFSDQISSSSSINSKPTSQVKKPDDEPENLMIITDNKTETMPTTKMEEPTDRSAESCKLQEADTELRQNYELNFIPDLQLESKDTLKVAGGGIIELQQLEALKKDLDRIDKQEFRYVKDVLELAGFSGDEALGAWHADKQPLDPMMYEEIRGCTICDPNCSTEGEEVSYCIHPHLFALINEVLLDVYERCHSYYPRALSHLCHLRPMPVGRHVLEQVWERIGWFMSFKPGYDKPLDYVASRDLLGDDGWMSLQPEHESLALEVEDLIFSDLLQELSSSY